MFKQKKGIGVSNCKSCNRTSTNGLVCSNGKINYLCTPCRVKHDKELRRIKKAKGA